jgi:hypothetical protein
MIQILRIIFTSADSEICQFSRYNFRVLRFAMSSGTVDQWVRNVKWGHTHTHTRARARTHTQIAWWYRKLFFHLKKLKMFV